MKITQNEIRLAENLQKFKEEFQEQTLGLLVGFQTASNLYDKPDTNNTAAKILEILKRIHILLNSTTITINNNSDEAMKFNFRWKITDNKKYDFYSTSDSIQNLMFIICSYKEAFVKEIFLLKNIMPENNDFTQFFGRMSYEIEKIVQDYVVSSDN